MKILFAFWMVFLSLLCTACGQSGPLYLPTTTKLTSDQAHSVYIIHPTPNLPNPPNNQTPSPSR